MTTEGYRQRLRDEERGLQTQLTLLEGEARGLDIEEVRDTTDTATSSELSEESLEESSRMSATLVQVREALQRIEAGTYGICAMCGRPIEPARLLAVPWASHCLEDQEKLERQSAEPESGATL